MTLKAGIITMLLLYIRRRSQRWKKLTQALIAMDLRVSKSQDGLGYATVTNQPHLSGFAAVKVYFPHATCLSCVVCSFALHQRPLESQVMEQPLPGPWPSSGPRGGASPAQPLADSSLFCLQMTHLTHFHSHVLDQAGRMSSAGGEYIHLIGLPLQNTRLP